MGSCGRGYVIGLLWPEMVGSSADFDRRREAAEQCWRNSADIGRVTVRRKTYDGGVNFVCCLDIETFQVPTRGYD